MEEVELLGVGGLAGAGIVLALIGILRQTIPQIPTRLIPALAILIGIGLNIAIKLDTVPTEESTWLGTLFLGIMAGLSASGVYSGSRAIAGK